METQNEDSEESGRQKKKSERHKREKKPTGGEERRRIQDIALRAKWVLKVHHLKLRSPWRYTNTNLTLLGNPLVYFNKRPKEQPLFFRRMIELSVKQRPLWFSKLNVYLAVSERLESTPDKGVKLRPEHTGWKHLLKHWCFDIWVCTLQIQRIARENTRSISQDDLAYIRKAYQNLGQHL